MDQFESLLFYLFFEKMMLACSKQSNTLSLDEDMVVITKKIWITTQYCYLQSSIVYTNIAKIIYFIYYMLMTPILYDTKVSIFSDFATVLLMLHNTWFC